MWHSFDAKSVSYRQLQWLHVIIVVLCITFRQSKRTHLHTNFTTATMSESVSDGASTDHRRRSSRLVNHVPNFRVDDATRKRIERSSETEEETMRRRATNAQQTASQRSCARLSDLDAIRTPENEDAKRYATAIQNTCVFHLCCVCALEGGNNMM